MENQSSKKGANLKNIQQNTDEKANGKPGTSLAEDTAINKEESSQQETNGEAIPKPVGDIENATTAEERMGNNGL